MKKLMGKVEIKACRLEIPPEGRAIVVECEESKAEFWGVSLPNTEGHMEWLVDAPSEHAATQIAAKIMRFMSQEVHANLILMAKATGEFDD